MNESTRRSLSYNPETDEVHIVFDEHALSMSGADAMQLFGGLGNLLTTHSAAIAKHIVDGLPVGIQGN